MGNPFRGDMPIGFCGMVSAGRSSAEGPGAGSLEETEPPEPVGEGEGVTRTGAWVDSASLAACSGETGSVVGAALVVPAEGRALGSAAELEGVVGPVGAALDEDAPPTAVVTVVDDEQPATRPASAMKAAAMAGVRVLTTSG
jgi:hypothetical protein